MVDRSTYYRPPLSDSPWYDDVMRSLGALAGYAPYTAPAFFDHVNEAGAAAGVFINLGGGQHLVAGSAGVFSVAGSTTNIGNLGVGFFQATTLSVGAGGATIAGDVQITGTHNLSVGGTVTVSGLLGAGAGATISKTSGPQLVIFGAPAANVGQVVIQGSAGSDVTGLTLRNASSASNSWGIVNDASASSILKFVYGESLTNTVLALDQGGPRVLIGAAAAVSATNDKMQVVGGRLYVMPADEQMAIGLRKSATGGNVYIGAQDNSANPRVCILNGGLSATDDDVTIGGATHKLGHYGASGVTIQTATGNLSSSAVLADVRTTLGRVIDILGQSGIQVMVDATFR